ncbi:MULTISPECIES: hypothetical protein [unclassified Campylobacter]|uniref:hypothetical protein n=1 Tax=unclassified Campylobacter TaxID=2593542 RepID=UPI001473BB29|nr:MULTISPECIES: hypothetical protein [unclassified Campylobacter]
MTEEEMWQEYDKYSFLIRAKSSDDFVWNAIFTKYSCTDMAKDFYRQAVKALNNTYDVIDEVKFILQNLDQDFGFDTKFVQEIRQMILNVEMTPYEYQEVSKILKSNSINPTW